MRVPVAVWQPCELLYTFVTYLLTYLLTISACDGHDRHMTIAYTALAWRHAIKTVIPASVLKCRGGFPIFHARPHNFTRR